MSEHILIIEGLKKRLGEVEVLAGVDARLRRGEITAFIGPNGAGKTTLFHAITGELSADAGRVIFEGDEVTRRKPWELARLGIGKMFQDVRTFPGLSVRDNMIAALQGREERGLRTSLLHGDRALAAARDKAEQLLDRVGVEGRRDGPAAELSWGNQKLLAFARLLAGEFRFVLLDEPVAGVSPALRERMKDLIRELARHDGVTVALIEHDMAFVRELADTVMVMNEGKIRDQGSALEVLERPSNMELCLGL
jgi:ABC-type branched-subunit amino acid transport system ATPase component